MNPFFFGSSASPLYGVFHPSLVPEKKNEGILLCPPFGQEYMRSHRAYRQLALLLNKQGFPVLRFDYMGTGDSYGEPEDATIQDWVDNIATAIEELKHSAQVDTVSLVGLRLGGLVAARYCCEHPDHINRLVLWDTIVSGERYIEELNTYIAKAPNSKSKCFDDTGALHFNGFALTKPQLDELKNIDLGKVDPSVRKVNQICSMESDNQQYLKDSWTIHEGYHYQHTAAPGDWNFVDDFGGILLPQQVIQSVVSSVCESRPTS